MHEPNDNLDQLLAQAPPPPAPPWFEQRLMARIRREEQERERPIWVRMWSVRTVSLAGAVCLLVAGSISIQTFRGPGPSESPALVQEEISEGLEAFVAYQEQSQTWSVEW